MGSAMPSESACRRLGQARQEMPPGLRFERRVTGQVVGSAPIQTAAVLYIDGSGTTADPRTRRCGRGVSWLCPAGCFASGCFGSLGYESHSVARAELAAVCEAVARTTGSIHVVTDCRYGSGGFLNRVLRARRGVRHCDVWSQIGRLASRRDVTVSWAKAHIDSVEQFVRHQRVGDHVVGNATADAMARAGAELGVSADDPPAKAKPKDENPSSSNDK